MVDKSQAEEGGHAPSVPVSVMMNDPAARLFALTHLVATLDGSGPEFLSQMLGAGVTPELIDRLRQMPLSEACRFAMGRCGVTIAIDGAQMSAQFGRIDRAHADREMLEYLIRHGASPALLTKLFGLSHRDARQMRRALLPESFGGGRPRVPDPDQHTAISAEWAKLVIEQTCPRARFRSLHQKFPTLSIASLELVVIPQPSWLAQIASN